MFQPTMLPARVGLLALGLAVLLSGPPRAAASTVIVPDDSSTVTSAIASGADTVLVREGTYVETPLIERDLVLQGVGVTNRPRLNGLQLTNLNTYTAGTFVSGFDVSGTVRYKTVRNKNPISVRISDCSLDSGVQVSAYAGDLVLSLLRCRMAYAYGGNYYNYDGRGVDAIFMEADTLEGGVSWNLLSASPVSIQHCWFKGHGATGPAVTLTTGDVLTGYVSHNQIEGYDTGIYVDETDGMAIDGNTITKCGTGISLGYRTWRASVSRNIVFGSTGWGAVGVDQPQLGCNDWFGNGLGAVTPGPTDASDLSVDPMFCDVVNADVRLDSASPLLADAASCGWIGALGVGCGATATLVQRFTAGRVAGGVRVVWQVAAGATASSIWVERAEGADGQAWTRPVMERSSDGQAVMEIDRTALPDHTYRYRLVAIDGGKLLVLDPGILVEAQARLSFALAQVGPSPGAGPLRIAFTLANAAAIRIDVFDLLGRRVATPAQGMWPAGTQVVGWDGLTQSGISAPAGMYVIRYAYPGGQHRRSIMRLR